MLRRGIVVGLGACSIGMVTAASGWARNLATAQGSQDTPFSQKEYREFELLEKFPVNHNTSLFRFKLPERQKLNLPVSSCVTVRIPSVSGDGKDVIRPYTPVSVSDQEGYFDLMIKVYENGKMSKHINMMNPGDKIEFMGPWPKWNYHARPSQLHRICMIAGGTGLTPMLQIIREIVKNNDRVIVDLIFANVTEPDILLKDELDSLAAQHYNIKIHYVVEKPSELWTASTGYVTKELISQTFGPPSDEFIVLVCGPPPMMKAISGDKVSPREQGPVEGILKELGFTEKHVYKF
jgi:cytochrome-b5 reductase